MTSLLFSEMKDAGFTSHFLQFVYLASRDSGFLIDPISTAHDLEYNFRYLALSRTNPETAHHSSQQENIIDPIHSSSSTTSKAIKNPPPSPLKGLFYLSLSRALPLHRYSPITPNASLARHVLMLAIHASPISPSKCSKPPKLRHHNLTGCFSYAHPISLPANR